MKQLFWSEIDRLWKRKVTWGCFLAIPVIILLSARFYLQNNARVPVTSAEYTVFGNFPVLALAEQLVMVVNLIALVLIVFTVTQEYRTGQLRMVLVRAYSKTTIFFAKLSAVLVTILGFFGVYFLCSLVAGYLLFPRNGQVLLFYHATPVPLEEALGYCLAYYGIGFLTMIGVACVLFFIASISRTVTTAMGLGLFFLISSLMYSTILEFFRGVWSPMTLLKMQFLTLPYIQYTGIAAMLAERPAFVGWNLGVLAVYTLFFGGIAYLVFTKEDDLC